MNVRFNWGREAFFTAMEKAQPMVVINHTGGMGNIFAELLLSLKLIILKIDCLEVVSNKLVYLFMY